MIAWLYRKMAIEQAHHGSVCCLLHRLDDVCRCLGQEVGCRLRVGQGCKRRTDACQCRLVLLGAQDVPGAVKSLL